MVWHWFWGRTLEDHGGHRGLGFSGYILIRSPSGFAQILNQILNLILNTLEYILVDRNAVGSGLGQFLPCVFVRSCLALWGYDLRGGGPRESVEE